MTQRDGRPTPDYSPPILSSEDLLARYGQGERDFSGITLNECTLMGVQLPQINLSHASLNIVNLSTANLSQSNLRRASLNVSRLSSTNFSHACMQGANINVANLIRAILVGADLSEASMIRTELLRADLSSANLQGADLTEADLREARLRWVNLQGGILNEADLRKANLTGVNLSGAQLHSANLTEAVLMGALLQGAEMRHCNLVKADLRGANLRGANLRWADLSGANLQEADLTDAKLSGAVLLGADLQGATLINTILVHADLTGVRLQQAYCLGGDFSGATLTGARLHGTLCQNLTVTDVVCRWIDLSPQGDQSQVQTFEPGQDLRALVNRQPPQVVLTLDTAMTLQDQAYLIECYGKLGQALPWFHRPPNVEVARRRTVLTFPVGQVRLLLAIAFLTTWPFQEGQALRPILIELASLPLEAAPARLQEKLLKTLEVTLAWVDETLAPFAPPAIAEEFLQAAIQIKVTHGDRQEMMLYHSPRFGVRHFPQEGNTPVTWHRLDMAPPPATYHTFLAALQQET